MNLTTSNIERVDEASSSKRARTTVVIAAAAGATAPIIAVVAGLDQFVLGRLAANHNEVAADD